MCEVEEVQDEQSLSHLDEHDDMNSDLEVKERIVSRVNEPLPMAELDGKSLGGKPFCYQFLL